MNKLSDYIKSTIDNRGRNPEKYYDIEQYPVIDNYLIKNTLYPDLKEVKRYIDEATFDNFLRGYVYKNMPLMTLVGNGIGNVTLAPNDNVSIIQNTIGFECKDNIDEIFLYYYLIYRQEFIKNFDRGSGQPSIRKTDLLNMEVSIPNLTIQKRVRDILFCLDLKIEENKKINNNLEEQIKVLYKYYFTDAKNDNWPEVNLSDLIFFQEGPGIRNWQYVDDGVKFINIRCITNGSIDTSTANKISTEEAFGKYSHFLLKPYDIVMSCSGTLGRYAIVQEENLPLCLNTSVIRFRPLINEFDYSFVYGYLSSPEFLNQQTMMANGSAQVNFGPTHLRKIIIKEPPVDTRKQFNELIMPIINKIICTRTENARLAALRDTLLPKLMSGEIDVSNITI